MQPIPIRLPQLRNSCAEDPKGLKDVEHLVNTEAEALGLERRVELFTGPANVLGIELNEYAAELARVTVWIGELQWRLDKGYPFKTNPVLEPLDHIECRDALLTWIPAEVEASESSASHNARIATEAAWPKADPALKAAATAIAEAAAHLNALREAWLNPPEWTQRLPEVVPLGMDHSPYPDHVVPKPGLSEADAKALQKRTFTNLYNARPAWLAMVHETLDAAVAAAYGWADYSPQMGDDQILTRLLALNLQRTGNP